MVFTFLSLEGQGQKHKNINTIRARFFEDFRIGQKLGRIRHQIGLKP